MGIEYNKDLHIELLMDEISLTRGELERKFLTQEAFKEIVSQVHSTVRMDELRENTKKIIEGSLGLKAYALVIWDSRDGYYIVKETLGLTAREKSRAIKAIEASIELNHGGIKMKHNMVSLPLSQGKAVLGALCLPEATYKAVSEHNREVMAITIHQLTKAIENSVLYETARKMCVTDDKTHLYNHRYLISRLDMEIKRAKRFDRQMSCLMLDVDDFKDFNDRFGHLAGDDALTELGRIIKSACRDIDIVARFGGEEFTVVLPETGVNGAETAASRILNAVRKHTFDTGKGSRTGLTVSAGVACFPLHAKDGSNLLKQSDIALYAAKNDGKDKHAVAVLAV
jgi:diguanylate cyclase (GGDEF)-like protein